MECVPKKSESLIWNLKVWVAGGAGAGLVFPNIREIAFHSSKLIAGVPGGALGGMKAAEPLDVEDDVVESNAESSSMDEEESEGSDGADGDGVGGPGEGSGGEENA